jgi:hypothetical protein
MPEKVEHDINDFDPENCPTIDPVQEFIDKGQAKIFDNRIEITSGNEEPEEDLEIKAKRDADWMKIVEKLMNERRGIK